jgi:regulator of replication initiation timing
MRQQSKQELTEENSRLRAELDRVHEALSAIMAGDAELVGKASVAAWRVRHKPVAV